MVERGYDVTLNKVVEHPDLFVESCNYNMEDFDYIIELREMKIKRFDMKK